MLKSIRMSTNNHSNIDSNDSLNNQIISTKFEKNDIHENIMCFLCEDFLVDAVTLTECLHFFCHSCLLRHLKSDNRCPKCLQDLGKDLSTAYRLDTTLQNLVYKLVPNFFWKQLRKHRRAIYSRKTFKSSQTLERRQNSTRNYLKLLSKICSETEKISLVVSYVSMSEIHGAIQKPSTSESQSYGADKSTDCTFKRYFLCPAKATLSHLKKLMEMKLAMSEPYAVYFIDNTFVNLLDDELSIQDLVYMYSWNRKCPLKILFTIVRLTTEEDRPPVLDIEIMPQLRPETSPNGLEKNDNTNINDLSNSSSALKEEENPPLLRLPQLHVSLPPSAFDSNGLSAIQPHSIIKSSVRTTPPSSLKSEGSSDSSKNPPQRKKRKSTVPVKAQDLENSTPSTVSNTPPPPLASLLSPNASSSALPETPPNLEASNSNSELSEFLKMPHNQIVQEKSNLEPATQNFTVSTLQQALNKKPTKPRRSYTKNPKTVTTKTDDKKNEEMPTLPTFNPDIYGYLQQQLFNSLAYPFMPSFINNSASYMNMNNNTNINESVNLFPMKNEALSGPIGAKKSSPKKPKIEAPKSLQQQKKELLQHQRLQQKLSNAHVLESNISKSSAPLPESHETSVSPSSSFYTSTNAVQSTSNSCDFKSMNVTTTNAITKISPIKKRASTTSCAVLSSLYQKKACQMDNAVNNVAKSSVSPVLNSRIDVNSLTPSKQPIAS